ncbi:MAG: hypothetical protein ABIO39_12355 [Caulobacteraceae bacterium]
MLKFAEWLSTTAPSVFIQTHQAWMIPTIQSVHIMGIGLVVGCNFMVTLRILGWAAMDQTLRQSHDRFGPWLTGALWLVATTGLLMVIGEPVRELVTFSFWLKMALVAVVVLIAVSFQRSLRRHAQAWENTGANGAAAKGMAILTCVILACIIILGRLIAYDHVWGHLSPATKA